MEVNLDLLNIRDIDNSELCQILSHLAQQFGMKSMADVFKELQPIINRKDKTAPFHLIQVSADKVIRVHIALSAINLASSQYQRFRIPTGETIPDDPEQMVMAIFGRTLSREEHFAVAKNNLDKALEYLTPPQT